MRKLGALARDRTNRLLVGVNDVERAEIKARAEAVGMTVSSYVRAAALGRPIRSRADQRAIEVLAEVNASQAALAEIMAPHAPHLVQKIEALQDGLAVALKGLTGDR